MSARHVLLAVCFATGCVGARHREPEETLWVRDPPEYPWLASRYHPYDPGAYAISRDWCVGGDGEMLLFTTRIQRSPGAFACVAGHRFWRDRDVVGYAPTGRIADPRTRDGRAWQEYRLIGGPDAPRVAEAISRQRAGRLDRPR